MSTTSIWRCWAALMVLLATTTGLAFVPLGAAQLAVSLVIAGLKALLVLTLFMELKSSTPLVRVFACAGFFWLLVMIGLSSADYSHRSDVRAPIDQVP